ncbi:putative anion transporter 1, chloroplastic [Dichanthelium oligosanthes]|uniref:Putative anion transporter 1, chloroplastic n=1 Tax=Dichanthelium oligosanthes TaxID=888268 RepID=A0A1E5VR28_9POAL|nr:putative anion transporter 1, chloroplastic [Dichanthelium oligosanthes]
MLLHLLPLSCPSRPLPTFRSSGRSGSGPWVRRAGGRAARRQALRGTDVQPETPPRGRRGGDGGHDPHADGGGGATLLETVRRLLLAREEADAEEGEEEPVGFPKRWAIVFLCFSAFLLCNMDRVNMSIAILPMSAEFGWNPQTVGLIQSSFFWGYLLTQIAGGIWADTVGGKTVLGFGVVWWSIATALTPVAAKLGLPFLLVVRAFMGIGEGVAMPAMNNILSKWIPVSERSRSLALVYSGMYLGTPLEDPGISAAEKKLITSQSTAGEPVKTIPWKLILSKPPVWALIVSHFCHNWGTFILLTWMPTYYNQVLKFNLMESGLICVLPWLTMAVSANIGGWIADTLVSRGVSVTTVRKWSVEFYFPLFHMYFHLFQIMQSIGFLGPAFFLTQLSHVNSPAMAVLCMACSQGTDAFSQSGLYSNHQDIGPRYAGVLLGLSNTAGVLAGVFGTAATGYILQHGSWDNVFEVSVVLYLVGTLVWNVFSTGEKILD